MIFVVTEDPGPAWDALRPRREQAGWKAHAGLRSGVLGLGAVEPWSVWLRAPRLR